MSKYVDARRFTVTRTIDGGKLREVFINNHKGGGHTARQLPQSQRSRRVIRYVRVF
jgi:hypothetical protein